MYSLNIKKASYDELGEIGGVYRRVIDYLQMPEHKVYTNWKYDIYPTENTGRDFIDKGELFVVSIDGIISASFALNHDVPNEYDSIDWGIDLKREDYIVLHTLAIDPDKMNIGIGKMVMSFIGGYAKSNGYKAVRLDTGSGNAPANRLYLSAGYELRGSLIIEPQRRKNREYNCYQKVLCR